MKDLLKREKVQLMSKPVINFTRLMLKIMKRTKLTRHYQFKITTKNNFGLANEHTFYKNFQTCLSVVMVIF